MQFGKVFKNNAVLVAAVAAVFLLWIACTARAGRTIYVDHDCPADFNSIQAAIDDSNDGDTIIVKPGTYTGPGNRDIDFAGKAITVRSADPNDPNIVATTIVDCNGTQTQPHRGFHFHTQEDSNSALVGFTITNGWAVAGGAIYCEADYFQRTSPTIAKCTITRNAAFNGGGIGCNWRGSPNIVSCTITENVAIEGSGGGIYRAGVVRNCTISGNCAAAGHGGGLAWPGSVDNCKIIGNAADRHGGGVWLCMEVTNCIIAGNTALRLGGGLHSCYSVLSCLIAANTSESGGGLSGCRGIINHSTIVYNRAKAEGGGIFSGYDDANFVLANSIVWGNEAAQGDAICLNTILMLIASPPYVIEKTSTMTARYSSIQGAQTQIHVDPNSTLIWGCGSIDADPCFVELGYWDANGTPEDPNDDSWVHGDYHMQPDSTCIDAGDPNYLPEPNETDLDGNPRIVDGDGDGIPVVDMGAYEAAPYVACCFGVNHLKIATQSGKKAKGKAKGDDLDIKGTFNPALPFDPNTDDVTYIIDDGQGNVIDFFIPAGSFKAEGKPEHNKFKYDSPKKAKPEIKAKFDFAKCKFDLKVKKISKANKINGTTLGVALYVGNNLGEQVLQVKAKKKHLEYRRKPKLDCCTKQSPDREGGVIALVIHD